jgi:hypothetical protein
MADACIFFAIEAGKRIPDKHTALGVADQVADRLAFLSADYSVEVAKQGYSLLLLRRIRGHGCTL